MEMADAYATGDLCPDPLEGRSQVPGAAVRCDQHGLGAVVSLHAPIVDNQI
jgi:hypothetical protein